MQLKMDKSQLISQELVYTAEDLHRVVRGDGDASEAVALIEEMKIMLGNLEFELNLEEE